MPDATEYKALLSKLKKPNKKKKPGDEEGSATTDFVLSEESIPVIGTN